jgi:O-glycosyl hydrolase
MKKGMFAGVVVPALVFALVFTACDTGSPKQKPNVQSPTLPAGENATTTYILGDTIDPLTVTATSPDGGELSYQWYSCGSQTEYDSGTGTLIPGATVSSYTLEPETVGVFRYYVLVTNTKGGKSETVKSGLYTIIIYDQSANAIFTVNTANVYQYVRGYGAMDCPWGNVVALDIQDYEKMYNPNELGYNIMRIMILANNTDVSVTMDNLTRPNGSRPNQIEGVKIVNKYGGYVLATPWSPPAAWKTNNHINAGGTLKPEHYQDFANYLNDFSRYMLNKGAPIYTVSMQNEPSYNAEGYEGCEYTPAEHLAFWQAVGNFTSKPGTPTGWGGGKQRDHVMAMSGEAHSGLGYLNSVAMNTTVEPQIDIMGRHIYGAGVDPGGTPSSTATGGASALKWGTTWRAARETAGRETWMTEYNTNTGNAQDATYNYVWQFLNNVDLTIRLNCENAFIWWTAKRFYSMIGDGSRIGSTQTTTTNHAVLPRGYALSHYAKFSKEMYQVGLTASGTLSNGTTAIGTGNFNHTAAFDENSSTARATAFMSEDGNTISLVMFTPTTTSGSGGYNMGDIRIVLPEDFTIETATAMRSTSANGGAPVIETVTVGTDRRCAYVNLPAGQILSVRFTSAD